MSDAFATLLFACTALFLGGVVGGLAYGIGIRPLWNRIRIFVVVVTLPTVLSMNAHLSLPHSPALYILSWVGILGVVFAGAGSGVLIGQNIFSRLSAIAVQVSRTVAIKALNDGLPADDMADEGKE